MGNTGIYHLPLLTKLLENDYFVCVENAFLLKKYFDVYLRKAKTDNLASLKLAKYCFEKWYFLKPFSISSKNYQELLFLLDNMSICCFKTKSKIQLTNLIDITFPEFSSCFNQDKNHLFLMLDLLEKFYHPSLVLKHTEKSFFNIIDKLAQKRGVRMSARISTYLYS